MPTDPNPAPPSDPHATGPGAAPAAATGPESLGSAPAGADAFDDWARRAADSWQRHLVFAEAARRLADPATPPAERALAAVWGAPVGAPEPDELAALAGADDLDDLLRARLRAALASVRVHDDPAAAVALVQQALPAVASDGVDIRTRLGVWFTASEVLVRAGRLKDAMEVLATAGEAVKAAADAPPWAFVAIDAERLGIMAPRHPNRQQLQLSAEKVAEAAVRLPASPTAVEVLAKLSGLMAGIGQARRAERYAERVVQLTSGVPEGQGLRFQALLVLADGLFSRGEVDEAMVAQRAAVATVEPAGDSAMLGWARRGLAVQLASLGRDGEAAEEFGRAAGVYHRTGMAYDATALRLEQAAALLSDDDPAAARSLVDEAQAAADELPEERRVAVQMRVHQVLAQLATYDGELETAAEHWLEVADLAGQVGASPLEARLTAAQLFAADGDLDEADAQFTRAELSAADEKDPARATAQVMRVRAETLRDAGRAEEAAELARIAANHARAAGDEPQALYLSVIAADSLHAAGQSAAAVQLYEETLAAARERELRELEGAVHAGLASVLRDLGRTDEAVAHEMEAQMLDPDAPPPPA